eukprot:GGOE01061132.1.p1 GENE.GGOE01061132.1~~GGOE01061132.1.p1  ORF type:complete len:211 (+),score=39.83 GGOE01061132.1:32-634(+)
MPNASQRMKRRAKALAVPVEEARKVHTQPKPFHEKFCTTCRFWGHEADLCPRKAEFAGKCGICCRAGHAWEECPDKDNEHLRKNCRHCGALGHAQDTCQWKELSAQEARKKGKNKDRMHRRTMAQAVKRKRTAEDEDGPRSRKRQRLDRPAAPSSSESTKRTASPPKSTPRADLTSSNSRKRTLSTAAAEPRSRSRSAKR